MNQRVQLLIALSSVTLGTAFVMIGVISPPMFGLGIYLIEIGCAATAVSGIFHVLRPSGPA